MAHRNPRRITRIASPSRPGRRSPPGPLRGWRSLVSYFASELQTARPRSWLVLLSLLDLVVTYALLQRGIGAYEANPIANWWFRHGNIAGMATFKFLSIGLIVTIGEIVERHRPPLGQMILWFGCAGTVVVALRGLQLYLRHAL